MSTEVNLERERLLPSRAFESAVKPRWSRAHYLALAGVPVLVWQTWTFVAWFADNPHQITEFRTHGSASWYAARVFEALAVLLSIPVIVHLVRDCKRRARILTFDVMFCAASATMIWADLGAANFFMPVWLPSSNFINVNAMCGHMPFVINPDCGRSPEPILFMLFFEAFLVLGFAIVISAGLTRVRSRYPTISGAKLFGIAFLVGFVFDIIAEPFFAIPIGLWAYPEGPGAILVAHSPFPLVELIGPAVWLAMLTWVRMIKNDRGESIAERGLERHSRPVRTGITFMALYALVQFIAWVPGNIGLMVYGFYERFPKLPAHIVNDVCDAPGVQGTRYGPCPGSPDFRMPVRHSLPGRSP